jgi:NitT/TauT family transport system permease protein
MEHSSTAGQLKREQGRQPGRYRPPLRAEMTWRLDIIFGLVLLASFLVLWRGLVSWAGYPSFILPSPGEVAAKLWSVVIDGSLWLHLRVTLGEIFGGLAIGLTTATCLGYLLAKSPRLERLISPYIVASQSVPVVALAPLLVIWFGFGSLSKILVCALIVFFPILVNTVVGIRSVEADLRDLMLSLRANRWQVFTMLELPAALPVLLGGLKIGVTLAVVGAVVGEFVGADHGLGFLVNLGRGIFDTALMFVALFALAVVALFLYGSVLLLEHWLLAWKRKGG